jgi:hypothetical protein
MKKIYYLSLAILPLVTTGCGNQLNCAINGDNVKGHIGFTSTITPKTTSQIVVQYSTNSFTSVSDSKNLSNEQGLVVLPYTFCAANDADIAIRAFQDDNGNGNWDSGEGAGRNDGTTDGNANYLTHNFPHPQPSATPPVEWKVDENVDITLDSTSSQ